jgi:hypothetical protein
MYYPLACTQNAKGRKDSEQDKYSCWRALTRKGWILLQQNDETTAAGCGN